MADTILDFFAQFCKTLVIAFWYEDILTAFPLVSNKSIFPLIYVITNFFVFLFQAIWLISKSERVFALSYVVTEPSFI